MAHNPYHVENVYDTTTTAPTTTSGLKGTGYDFTKTPTLEEGEKDLSIYFDPYDKTGEDFAGAGQALNQAYFNDQLSGLTSGTQSQLKDLTQSTPSQGFSRSGGMERNVQNTREDIMRGYTAGKQGIDYQRGRSNLGYQEDIWGMRQDYEKDQKQRLIDLITADPSNLEKYHEDYEANDTETAQQAQQRRNNLPSGQNFQVGDVITQDGRSYRWNGQNWEDA